MGKRKIIFLLQILGVWSQSKTAFSSKLFNIFVLFNILILLTIISIQIFTCGTAIEQTQGALDTIADSILFINPIITHFVILIEGLRNKIILEKCWIKFQKVDLLINKSKVKNFKKLRHNFIRKQYWNFFFAIIVSTCFEIKIMCTIRTDNNWFWHWVFTEFSHIMVRVGNLIYIFYIDLITFYIKLLNAKLDSIASLSRLFENKKSNKVLEKVVKRHLGNVMNAHYFLKVASDDVNKALEWSQLFNFTQNLIGMIMDFYFLTNAWLFMSLHRYGKIPFFFMTKFENQYITFYPCRINLHRNSSFDYNDTSQLHV